MLLPAVEIVTASLPEVALVPDHDPDAEQEVALEEDQVRVEVFVKRTDIGSADKLTVGAGVTGAAGEPPPPPPPPHEISIRVLRTNNKFFTFNNCDSYQVTLLANLNPIILILRLL